MCGEDCTFDYVGKMIVDYVGKIIVDYVGKIA